MLDRTITPPIKEVDSIHFVEPKIYTLNGQTKLFLMKEVFDETVRLEFRFQAGSIHGEKNAANFVNSLLFSGTADKTSRQIHEELDQLGAYLDHEVSSEKAFVNVYCLRKNIRKVADIVYDAINHASFPEHEIADMVREKKQRLLVSFEKVSFMARRAFQQHLFASNPTYCRQLELEDFEKIEVEKLKIFHREKYLKGLTKMVVVSDIDEATTHYLIDKFKDWSSVGSVEYEHVFQNDRGTYHIEKAGAIQTAIRMGFPLFNKRNPDFVEFQFLQTILGDYFGSRLMSNIREDKGYTYGVGCSLVETKNTGYFVIATEVGQAVCNETLKEIEFEINRLRNERVEDEELNLVKNYLIGQLLKSADGPNSMMDMFLNVHEYDLDLDFYKEYLDTVKKITAQKVQEMAVNYLNWSNFTIITAGQRN